MLSYGRSQRKQQIQHQHAKLKGHEPEGTRGVEQQDVKTRQKDLGSAAEQNPEKHLLLSGNTPADAHF